MARDVAADNATICCFSHSHSASVTSRAAFAAPRPSHVKLLVLFCHSMYCSAVASAASLASAYHISPWLWLLGQHPTANGDTAVGALFSATLCLTAHSTPTTVPVPAGLRAGRRVTSATFVRCCSSVRALPLHARTAPRSYGPGACPACAVSADLSAPPPPSYVCALLTEALVGGAVDNLPVTAEHVDLGSKLLPLHTFRLLGDFAVSMILLAAATPTCVCAS